MMFFLKSAILVFYIVLFSNINVFAQQINVPPMDAEFQGMDANKDGFMTLEEMQAYQEKKFSELDKDKNGVIDKEELKADKTEMFKKADKNNDEQVTRKEAFAQFNEYFNQMDSNKDNKVSEKEYREYWPVAVKF